MSQVLIFLLVSCIGMLATVPAGAGAQQDCPGLARWHLKCPQYCCLEELDEPLEGQYCCGSCRNSFDPAVRNSFACKASVYLHQTWAVVLIACGIAFIFLVCCTCCCCCCCAPCRNRRRQSRSYSLSKHHYHHQHQQYQYGSFSGAACGSDRTPLLAPSAPPPPSAAGFTSSFSAHHSQVKRAEPPPYQEAAGATCSSSASDLPPPVYRP